MMRTEWKGFICGQWMETIDVRDFIIKNYKPYDGNEEFLEGTTARTKALWEKCLELLDLEMRNGGVLDIDASVVSDITSHNPGYIDKDLEIITGLQTDRPLKRAVVPYGGIRMVKHACQQYNVQLAQDIDEIFSKYCKTHNDGVFSVYTDEMRRARRSGVITGLPDAYGRGRIIGDYRRVALYGVDRLIEEKKRDLKLLADKQMSDEVIRLREEIYEQINALNDLVRMANSYGYDVTRPAANATEAIQWTYLAFLGAMKQTNGAANSLGRVSNFFDIYIERDMNNGILTEKDAQELIDQFVIKLRLIRHLRTAEYNELFAGDPVWITESIGGMCQDGRHMVTKTSYRMLHTLFNLGPSPEPNLTVLWSNNLPRAFKLYCARVSKNTSAIQYENDELMRPLFGDDYGISCCVSAMRIGKDMQYFGARCNLPKLLLLALNGGRDELTGEQVAPENDVYNGEYLDYDEVCRRFLFYQEWLAKLYVNTMNVIHYMHDKYAYEKLMMALHDTDVRRFMAFGIAGLSVLVDSMSAIKYSRVKPVKDSRGIITSFVVEGDYPRYGNDDDRVDNIAIDIVKGFYSNLAKYQTYRDSIHTLSILTITSNIVYGKKTGNTPDGRKKGEPFAPGANPMHGRDTSGVLAAMNSVAKLPYEFCRDGISFTLTLVPQSLGKDDESALENLVALLDGYFMQGGHHVNINVVDRETLERAMAEPYNYPQLTIRVSGYAVNFVKLTRQQQEEVISRTFHKNM